MMVREKMDDELMMFGALQMNQYGNFIINLFWSPGFDVTVQLDLSNIPENWEEIVKKWVICLLQGVSFGCQQINENHTKMCFLFSLDFSLGGSTEAEGIAAYKHYHLFVWTSLVEEWNFGSSRHCCLYALSCFSWTSLVEEAWKLKVQSWRPCCL